MAIIEHFLGEITMFAGNYAPKGWAFCDGAQLDISQHSALYAVIGDLYGGDGRVHFNLPNLKGRFPVHRGNQFPQGYSGGYTQVTLDMANLPTHTHDLYAFIEDGTSQSPVDNLLADTQSRFDANIYAPMPNDASKLATMNKNSLSSVGGTASGPMPIPTVPPFTAVNFIICLDGIFPSRN